MVAKSLESLTDEYVGLPSVEPQRYVGDSHDVYAINSVGYAERAEKKNIQPPSVENVFQKEDISIETLFDMPEETLERLGIKSHEQLLELLEQGTTSLEVPARIETVDQAVLSYYKYLRTIEQREERSLEKMVDPQMAGTNFMMIRAAGMRAFVGKLEGHCEPEVYSHTLDVVLAATELALVIEADKFNINVDKTRIAGVMGEMVDLGVRDVGSLVLALNLVKKTLPEYPGYADSFANRESGVIAEVITAAALSRCQALEQEGLYVEKTSPSVDLNNGVDFAISRINTNDRGDILSHDPQFYVDIKVGFNSTAEGVGIVLPASGANEKLGATGGDVTGLYRTFRHGAEAPSLDTLFDIPDSTLHTSIREGIPVIVIRVPSDLVHPDKASELGEKYVYEYNTFITQLNNEVTDIIARSKKGNGK